MPVNNRIAEFHEDMKAWRRQLHANPELLYDLPKTTAFVVERLTEFGVDEIVEGIGKSGVVAIIRGQGDGPVIGLRADMDALPIEEIRDLPYKSQVPGKMHACGHDGHVTILLGAARYLAETRNFNGTVALIFQPAEEGGAGGKAMCDDGLMDRFGISQVYALHNWPGMAVGRIEMRSGPCMASGDVFDIEITGKGGHAAMPNQGIDPVLVGVEIVGALQSIASRNVDPMDSVVVSVTRFQAGDTHNVIPETAVLGGTVRTLRNEIRDLAETRLRALATGIAEAYGASASIRYTRGYPVTVNHAEAVEIAARAAADVVGEQSVLTDRRAEMGSEDFSYMLEERPGAYVWLGQGDSAALHHPEYDFNDEVSPIGASFFARLVETTQPVSR